MPRKSFSPASGFELASQEPFLEKKHSFAKKNLAQYLKLCSRGHRSKLRQAERHGEPASLCSVWWQ